MKANWDAIGERFYETGVDHGLLFPQKNGAYPKGVVWNGLTGFTKSPTGAENNPVYADNMKYLNLRSAEEFGATIECITYPEEWKACDGTISAAKGLYLGQQKRENFGFYCRTKKGSDTNEDLGYIHHFVYNASAVPSETSYTTVNDSPETATFSYEVSTTAIPVPGKDPDGNPFRPTAYLYLDSTEVPADKLTQILEIIEGKDGTGDSDTGTDPRLPLPEEFIQILSEG